MKTKHIITGTILMLALATACSDSDLNIEDIDNGGDTSTELPAADVGSIVTINNILDINKKSHESEADYSYNPSDITEITLNNTSITIDGIGATATNSIATITQGGTYRISGTLTDGQIIVNSEDDNTVQLIFNGIKIDCSYNAPIYIKQAEKTVIFLEDNTTSYIADTSSYTEEEEDANAAIYSEDDLSFTGTGTLNVTANYNDAITSKDGLVINSGNFIITSVDDGIRGKDYLIINDATVNLNVEGDGFKSDEDEDDNKGFITINNIDATIIAQGDAIQSETNLLIYDGAFNLTSGGGADAYLAEDDSAKGLKAGTNIAIVTGDFIIDSADDTVHSNNSILINSGNFTLSSGDDGIHSDEVLEINGGTISITKSYEGIESADLTINNGTIHIVSSDDGLNVAGGADSSGFGGGFGNSDNYYMYINGGHIVINASGDGLDANGSIEMTGGTVIVNGPTSNGNGALDYDNTFKITGGTFIAVGSSGMAQTISSVSTQYGALAKFSGKSAKQMVSIVDSNGNAIFSFVPEKSYQSLAFSTPDLEKGKTYSLYFGGSNSGTETDGLYLNGAYTPGTASGSFTVKNIVTQLN